MTEVQFTHAKFNGPVILYAEMIVGVCFAPTMQATVVLGPGGSAIPVLGTVDEVNQSIQQARKEASNKESK